MGKRRLKKGVCFFHVEKKENGCLGALKRVCFFFHVEKKENGCFRANLTAVILGTQGSRRLRRCSPISLVFDIGLTRWPP